MKPTRTRVLVATLVALILTLAAAFYFAPVAIGVATMRAGLQIQGFEKRQIETSRGTVVYFENGEGEGETLLFLHGLQDQAGGWWRVAGEFDDRYHVVVPDLIGHGESGPRSGPIHPRDAIVQLDALLDRTSPDRPVTLVGNSMGGGIALGFALAHPERVERIVLIDSAGLKMKLVKDRFLPRNASDVRQTLRLVLGPDATLPPDFVLRRMREHAWEGPTPRLWENFSDGSAFLDRELPTIDTPADLVWGTQDGLIPIDIGRRMNRLLPRSRFHTMRGCGHSPQVDCRDRLVALLAEILSTKPPSVEATDENEVDEISPSE